MPSNSATMLPPLEKTPQRAKTAHTSSSLPFAGSARVSTHPLLPPHHMMRRHPHHHDRHHSPQTHHRHVSDMSGGTCSLTEHIVGMYDAPELPEIADLLRQGAASRATIVLMIEQGICRTSFNDVQRFPAIHPSIMSARMDTFVRYITFVSAPPIERRAPKDRPKSWNRKVFKPLGPEECFRCQLQTDHAVCERHKYLRVGGGFRHSYWYIKQTMDIIEVEHRKVTEEVQQRYLMELTKKARQAQTRRRIKTYVRGADGKVISRYCFVTEEEYQEMKSDDKLAKKILGLAEGEELDDWVSSKQKYTVDEKGEIVKVSKRKIRDSAYEESVESADVNNNNYRKDGRRRGRKGRHHRRYSDSDSFESGMGNSILEEGERGRRRRHRRRGRHGSGGHSSSVESIESYVSEGGTRRKRKVHRRRRHSRDGSESSYYEDVKRHRRRRRPRDRSYSRSDSGTGMDSDDSHRDRRGQRRGGRHGRRRHHGRHRGDDSYSDNSGSSDGRDGECRRKRGGRKRGRRRIISSYSEDSDNSRRSKRRGGRRHRKRYSSYSDESDFSGEGEGGVPRKRRGRHHRSRRHRGHSSSDSSDRSNSEDSRRRDRRHQRRHRRRHGSGVDESDESSTDGGDIKRSHHRGRRHHHRQFSDPDSESSQGGNNDEGEGGARGGRRRRRRHRRPNSNSDNDSDSDGGSISNGRSRRRRRRTHHYSESSEVSYDSDEDVNRGSRKKGGRRGGKHGRTRHRRRSHDRESFHSDDSFFSLTDPENPDKPRIRRRRHPHNSKDKKRGSYSSSASSYSSEDLSSSETLPVSSDVSDATDPSSVHSSDLSDISSTLDDEERQRIKAVKKANKMEQKRAAKQQLKVETRKEAREAKREKMKQEKKKRRRDKREERRSQEGDRRGRGNRRDGRDKKRRHHTPTSRSVSQCSSVSTLNSDDISDVGSALVGEERKQAIEAKKAQKKAEKKAIKQKQKVQKVKDEHREKRKEKERKRIKREIEREVDRMSSPSDVSSVRSSDLSSLSEQDEDITEEEKAKRKDAKKKKKKEEKKKEKKLLQAVQKVMAKRKKRQGSNSSDDSYGRGKQDFYDLPPEVQKTMVKYSKGSKRGLVDGDGMEWLDDWKNKKEQNGRKKKNKKGRGELTGETIELKAPDGRVVRIPKTSLYDVWRQARKIRLKKDGTVARDSDSDAESIELDSDGNMATQPHTVELTEAGQNVRWEGFAPSPQPPLTPTQGGKIQFQGIRKVHHAFRKDDGVLSQHLRKVLDTASELSEHRTAERVEAARVGYERSAWESVDFISHFRLVESSKLDSLGRAFVVEDVDYDCTLTAQEMRSAVECVPSLSSIKSKQLDYVLKVLNIDDHTTVSFKMFAVVAGVCERMCNMDSFGKYILDKTDLLDIARKMALYKSIFYCNVNSERSNNHITAESLRIELIAGGLNRDQECYILSKMNPNEYREISFFDYMAYIPLFLSMHENIIDNPLDQREKYTTLKRAEIQRDMNPLGLPLQRTYIDAPKEIFPSGIAVSSIEGGATTPRGFIERGQQLNEPMAPGKGARLPSIAQKSPSQTSTKRSSRFKNTTVSLP